MSSADTSDRPVVWADPLVQLYEHRLVELVRLAYLIVGHRAVAEDLAHDAFLSCHQAWDRVEQPWPYLRTCVVNAARSWLRRQEVARRHEVVEPEPALQHPDELWDALGRLSERYRVAIVLRFYEGMSDEHIGEVLDCRPATVRSLVHRGLRQLRKEIRP